MPWLSHKTHISERKTVKKGKPKTAKISVSKERRYRK